MRGFPDSAPKATVPFPKKPVKTVEYAEGEDRLAAIEKVLDGKENSLVCTEIDGLLVIVAKGKMCGPVQSLVMSACSMSAVAFE